VSAHREGMMPESIPETTTSRIWRSAARFLPHLPILLQRDQSLDSRIHSIGVASRSLIRPTGQLLGLFARSMVHGKFGILLRPPRTAAAKPRCVPNPSVLTKSATISAKPRGPGWGRFFDYVSVCCLRFKSSQSGASSADIACENHGSIFLHCRPSRPSNSSDSTGPHVPDG
jgi:hypothetical protein